MSQADTSFPDPQQISALARMARGGRVSLMDREGHGIPLPEEAAGLLGEILENMATGKSVAVVGQDREVTADEAARLLDVPLPFLSGLVKDRELRYHLSGNERLFWFGDVLALKRKRDIERHEAIGRMALMELEAGTYDRVLLPEGEDER